MAAITFTPGPTPNQGGTGATTMNEVSPKIIKKIQTLAQIAADLRDGKDYNITRLTLLKSLCSDPEAAAKFALHLAKRTLEKMKSQDCPSHIKPEDWEHYQRLAAKAVRGMTKHLKQRTPAGESPLHELLQIIRDAQGEFERQQWGLVRRIHSRELHTVETALECVLRPNASQLFAYDLAPSDSPGGREEGPLPAFRRVEGPTRKVGDRRKEDKPRQRTIPQSAKHRRSSRFLLTAWVFRLSHRL